MNETPELSPTDVTPAEDSRQAESGFAAYDLPVGIVEKLAARGITTPSDVQHQSMEQVRRGANLIVQAKTGTGKTFAFGLPLIAALEGAKGNRARVLVVTPTRELCLQVWKDLHEYGGVLGLRVASVYGGADLEKQVAELNRGVDIVVGTPGRLLDLAQRGGLRLDEVAHVVLDEADEMLDMGFLPDVTRLMDLTKNRHQTLLFSATMPNEIITLARRFMTNPTYIQVADNEEHGATVARVTQHLFQTHPLDKPEVLGRVLQAEGRGATIVFCRTKRMAQRLSDEMGERGFSTGSVHGDLSQIAREKGLADFRAGKIEILIATDVAARGIDVSDVTHVINYDVPEDAATYLHRIGRTARAGKSGTAITFVDWEHVGKWKFIADELALELPVPVETFSTSDHLYSVVGIPAGSNGRLRPAPQVERSTSSAGRAHSSSSQSRSSQSRSSHSNGSQAKSSRPASSRDSSHTTHSTEPRSTEPRTVRVRQRTRRGSVSA